MTKVICSKTGLVASASEDRTVRIWELASGKLLHTFVLLDKVYTVALSLDGRLVAAPNGDKEIIVWEVASGKQIRRLQAKTYRLAFAPDSQTLASASNANTSGGWLSMSDIRLQIWNMNEGVFVEEVKVKTFIKDIGYSPDCKRIALAKYPGVEIYKLSGGLAKEIELETTWWATQAVAFSPCQPIIAAVYENAILRLWDYTSGQLLREAKEHRKLITNVAFSPTGHIVATGSVDHTVRFWGLPEM